MTEPNPNTTNTEPPYEEEVKARIAKYHWRLKELAEARDSAGLTILKTAIDGEVAIADLKIKSRQAGHAWWFVWAQVGLPALTALIGLLIGAQLKK